MRFPNPRFPLNLRFPLVRVCPDRFAVLFAVLQPALVDGFHEVSVRMESLSLLTAQHESPNGFQ
jgi:hypothetical protein